MCGQGNWVSLRAGPFLFIIPPIPIIPKYYSTSICYYSTYYSVQRVGQIDDADLGRTLEPSEMGSL